MNIDIDGLRAFVKVAEFGNFRQAADALFLSQSALSRRISRLEQYLAIRLLDRDTRHVNLTTIGRNFLPQARRLVDELEASFNNLRKISKHGIGQVVLACIPTFATGVLPRVLAEYSAKYPHNRIRILDVHAEQVTQAVLGGEAEFGITLSGARDSDARFQPLMKDPFVVAFHREHPLAKRKRVKWTQLNRQRLIAVGRLGVNRSILDFGLPAEVLHQNWYYEVQHSFSTGIDLAAGGLGVLVVPKLALPAGSHPSLVTRPLVEPVVSRNIVVVRRRMASLSPAANEFLALLVKRGRIR